MAVTVSGTSITFNDASVQTTAAGGVPAFLGVGSVLILYNFARTSYTTGATVNAANTGYPSGVTPTNFTFNYSTGRTGNTTSPGPAPAGNLSTTAVTGTWRVASGAPQGYYDPCGNTSYAFPFLAVRIA